MSFDQWKNIFATPMELWLNMSYENYAQYPGFPANFSLDHMISDPKCFRWISENIPKDHNRSEEFKKIHTKRSSKFVMEIPDPNFHLYADPKLTYLSCPWFTGLKTTHLQMLILTSPDSELWNQLENIFFPSLKQVKVYGTYDEPEKSVTFVKLLILKIDVWNSKDLTKFVCLKGLKVDYIKDLILPDIEILQCITLIQVPNSVRCLFTDELCKIESEVLEYYSANWYPNVIYKIKKSNMSLIEILRAHSIAEKEKEALQKTAEKDQKTLDNKYKRKLEKLNEWYEAQKHGIEHACQVLQDGCFEKTLLSTEYYV